jgi:hypothetical protein
MFEEAEQRRVKGLRRFELPKVAGALADDQGKPIARLVGGAGALSDKKPEKAPAATGPARRRCSTMYDAPCRSMRRNPFTARRPTRAMMSLAARA